MSREAFEEKHRALIDALRRLDCAGDSYSKLLDQFTNLANPPTSPHLPTRNGEKPEPSIIAKTIREEAGGDRRLAHYFRKRANQLRRENPDMSPEEIAEQLASWETTDSEAGG